MLSYLILALVCVQAAALTCLNQQGDPVEWWIIFKVPPKIGLVSYGYYDSRTTSGQFKYYDLPVDSGDSPLSNTIDAFNSANYSRIAWNDQKPSGQVSSSAAHSKGFIGFDRATKKGFFISHSIPKYPAIQDGKIVKLISPSQQIYGQHLSCFSLTMNELDTLASNLLIIKPYIYEGVVENSVFTQNLYKLAQSNVMDSSDLFLTANIKSALGYGIMSIYKNHKVNGSIFEDGLTSLLGVSPLIAETWGRPLAQAWCTNDFEVNNVLQIQIGDAVWNQSDDHSKWVLGGADYACFGDMNRMTSQWKRGGAFYCLNDKSLVAAVKKTVVNSDGCSQLHLSTQ